MKGKNMEKKCVNCQCWERSGVDGICRSNAPKAIIAEAGKPYTVVWPRTNPEDGCYHDFVCVQGAQ